MFQYLKKAVSGNQIKNSRNNLIRDEYRKNNIKVFLASSIKLLQKLHIDDPDTVIERNDEAAQNICIGLEAVFLHELLDKGSYVGNNVNLKSMFTEGIQFANDDIISVAFWDLVKEVTHSDVITQLKHLVVTSEVGLSRAWIRLALNDSLIVSYLDAVLADKNQLRKFYSPNAFLMDSELPDIIKELLQGLMQFQFRLNYNSSKLNTWDMSSLQLAGLIDCESVDSAVTTVDNKFNATERLGDVSSSKYNGSHNAELSNVVQSVDMVTSPKALTEPVIDNVVFTSMNQSSANLFDTKNVSPISHANTIINTEPLKDVKYESTSAEKQTTINADQSHVVLDSDNDKALLSNSASELISTAADENVSSFDVAPSPKNVSLNIGNRLGGDGWSGWSSSFVDEPPLKNEKNVEQDKSFDSLLKTYGTNNCVDEESDNVDGVPRYDTSVLSLNIDNKRSSDDIISPTQSDANLQQLNFEVVPRDSALLPNSVDERTQSSLEQLTCIAWERGLDKENFRCKHCSKPIGLIYGSYKVCYFDGGYYCNDCHDDEEHLIPAQVIQNWQFQKYKVSKYNKLFLMKIEEEPLFHVDEINPSLYEVILDLKEVKILRIQLQHIKEYIQTCRQGVTEDFRRRLWPREYLSDDVHQYSLLDLVQVRNGQLAHHLRKIISQFSKHIYNCNLCCQKGFICEYCHDSNIIYPFEIQTAVQCRGCQSVFHRKCHKDKRCPKCVRIHLRLQNTNSDIHHLLSVTQTEQNMNTDIL